MQSTTRPGWSRPRSWAGELRETHADLGVIASEFFFDHVIKQHGGQPSVSASYQKVRFQSKESMLTAWIHLAGSRTDCALAD